jgi:hypothetical protein
VEIWHKGPAQHDPEGREEPEVLRATRKLRYKGHLAYLALWILDRGGQTEHLWTLLAF